MVLIFGDTHIGYKFYNDSFDSNTNMFPSELDCYNVLDEVYHRASKDDIELVIHTGDVFHTPTPTTKNISKVIEWLKKMSALNKPVYIITGNHDVSLYSNSLVYIHNLELPNIYLLDSQKYLKYTIKYHDWSIVFVPYVIDTSTLDKDLLCRTSVQEILANPVSEKQIIVTHIQESSCVRGSEGTLISHSVPVLEVDTTPDYSTSIILSGHIHYGQVYQKKNAIVMYPGSAISMDFSDINQIKSYLLLSPDGSYTIESFNTIRKFKSIVVPDNVDNIVEYLAKIRLIPNSVYFILIPSTQVADRKAIKELLESRKVFLGDIRFVNSVDKFSESLISETSISESLNYTEILEEYINGLDVQKFSLSNNDKNSLLSLGLDYLNQCMK